MAEAGQIQKRLSFWVPRRSPTGASQIQKQTPTAQQADEKRRPAPSYQKQHSRPPFCTPSAGRKCCPIWCGTFFAPAAPHVWDQKPQTPSKPQNKTTHTTEKHPQTPLKRTRDENTKTTKHTFNPQTTTHISTQKPLRPKKPCSLEKALADHTLSSSRGLTAGQAAD